MIEFTIVNYVQRQATSAPGGTKKRPESFAYRAHKVLQRFRSKEHRTLEEVGHEDLLDHVIFNGTTYDAIPGKEVESDHENRFLRLSPSLNNRKTRKIESEVELRLDSVNELWKGKSGDKAERLANWAQDNEQSSARRRTSLLWSRFGIRASVPSMFEVSFRIHILGDERAQPSERCESDWGRVKEEG
ncbi:hypothetical protein NECAME_05526 [Necator americanus]|uniref:Uncharacterized protein n=1 Tax=Necator americanus TaxID=51031 RepID=W2SII1_NECAM|nr:hypothetical protein NECAME_05526 [Necator americanus]ETN68681.1 hypothetical protein NECAME_05526 [Necator americanus]